MIEQRSPVRSYDTLSPSDDRAAQFAISYGNIVRVRPCVRREVFCENVFTVVFIARSIMDMSMIIVNEVLCIFRHYINAEE